MTRPITQYLVPNIQCQRRGPSRTDSRPRLMQDLDVAFAGIGCWLLAVSVWCCFLFSSPSSLASFPLDSNQFVIVEQAYLYASLGAFLSPCCITYAHNVLYPTRCETKFPIQYPVSIRLDRGGAEKKRSIGQTSCSAFIIGMRNNIWIIRQIIHSELLPRPNFPSLCSGG